MIEILQARRDAIVDACKAHGVARLDVFGLASRGDARAEVGDVDLLVEFVPMPATDPADAYFGLLDDLRAIVAMPVDLVMHDAIRNEHVRTSIDRERRPLSVPGARKKRWWALQGSNPRPGDHEPEKQWWWLQPSERRPKRRDGRVA